MNTDGVRALLESVAAGEVSATVALERLMWLPAEEVIAGEVPFARVDHHRQLRQGIPEVVLADGKTTAQTLEICSRLAARAGSFLATRVPPEAATALRDRYPAAEVNELARTVLLRAAAAEGMSPARPVAVLSAGTSDLPVAEEAAVTAAAFGARIQRVYDVGVAGLHRVAAASATLREAGVVIVVAGMEGALPSVIGGLVGVPVIAVPTSVGYGASFHGLAALLGMLNSCAAGVTVVNIDNGFGAACAAIRILRAAEPAP
ncbi:MAG: nickel pincer cofactor biosynthesis protein LarB [Gemmatimonadetes bacterium]|nr:nickel pincer cofactor biosynthesis protein LarB [Gemmatimonadota bacterium]